MVRELPAEALDALVDVAGEGAEFPLFSVELRHLNGEFARPPSHSGALPSIQAHYLLRAVAMLPAPELESSTRAHVETVKAAFGPWAASEMNLNFAETKRDPRTFWTEKTYNRLRQIKTTVDHDNIIRSNHPIPPAA